MLSGQLPTSIPGQRYIPNHGLSAAQIQTLRSVAIPTMPTEYWVDPSSINGTASDSNAGTKTSPFLTVNKAIKTATSSNIIIRLMPCRQTLALTNTIAGTALTLTSRSVRSDGESQRLCAVVRVKPTDGSRVEVVIFRNLTIAELHEGDPADMVSLAATISNNSSLVTATAGSGTISTTTLPTLTAPYTMGQTTLSCDTAGMPTSGTVFLGWDGLPLSYTGKTSTSLTGVSLMNGVTSTSGQVIAAGTYLPTLLGAGVGPVMPLPLLSYDLNLRSNLDAALAGRTRVATIMPATGERDNIEISIVTGSLNYLRWMNFRITRANHDTSTNAANGGMDVQFIGLKGRIGAVISGKRTNGFTVACCSLANGRGYGNRAIAINATTGASANPLLALNKRFRIVHNVVENFEGDAFFCAAYGVNNRWEYNEARGLRRDQTDVGNSNNHVDNFQIGGTTDLGFVGNYAHNSEGIGGGLLASNYAPFHHPVIENNIFSNIGNNHAQVWGMIGGYWRNNSQARRANGTSGAPSGPNVDWVYDTSYSLGFSPSGMALSMDWVAFGAGTSLGGQGVIGVVFINNAADKIVQQQSPSAPAYALKGYNKYRTATGGYSAGSTDQVVVNLNYYNDTAGVDDLRPAAGSTLLSSGFGGMLPKRDILGYPRSISTPSIGAYENAAA